MSKEALDWSKWLPILISCAAVAIALLALFWNVAVEHKRSKANLEVWQRNHYYLVLGSNNDRTTEIELLFRNLSHRPTAIIDIYLRNKEGGVLGGQGYNNKIELPIQIEPWGVKTVHFKLEKNDEERISSILVRDIEDNEIVIVRTPGQTWVKTKSNR